MPTRTRPIVGTDLLEISGLSSDTKPGVTDAVTQGSEFTEDDTGDKYVWIGPVGPWVKVVGPAKDETVLALVETNKDILVELQHLTSLFVLFLYEREGLDVKS